MTNLINQLMSSPDPNSNKDSELTIPNVNIESLKGTIDLIKAIVFPGYFNELKEKNLSTHLNINLNALKENLEKNISSFMKDNKSSIELTNQIIVFLPLLKTELLKDIKAIFNGDPAAKSMDEVILAYPSFEAILIYRVAHKLTILNLDLLARILSSVAHRNTGIDIHPKAKIGHSFCIDHGTGVVIGETAIIGNHVKLYQGVTIGALSVSKEQTDLKRHPTIEDNVTIYARTTILGGETIVGKNSIIGGNVWLIKSVPENSKIYTRDFKIEHS